MFVGLRKVAADIANQIIPNPEQDSDAERLPASSCSGFGVLLTVVRVVEDLREKVDLFSSILHLFSLLSHPTSR